MTSRFITSFLVLACATAVYAQRIVPNATQITFTGEAGGVPQWQIVGAGSSAGPLLITVSVSTYGTGNWLSASPNNIFTPAGFVITADPGLLTQGVYSGRILLSAPGATNSPVAIDVTFKVGAPKTSPLLVSPAQLSFTAQAGGVLPGTQSLTVASTSSGVSFTGSVTTDKGGQWLSIDPASATTPAEIVVKVNSSGLPKGTYTGTITLTPVTGDAVQIPVTLNLTSGVVVSTDVSALQFYYQIGAGFPGYQSFTISTGNASLSFGASAATVDQHNWLTVSPTLGTTPKTLTVTVSPNILELGTYTGIVSVSTPDAANPLLQIPVKLTVGGSPLLTVGALPPPFWYQIGGSIPPPVSIPIGSSSGTLDLNVVANKPWIVASLNQEYTPASLTIGVAPQSLAAGDYTGRVTVFGPGADNSPFAIPVQLSVGTGTVLALTRPSLVLNYQIGGANQVLSQTLGVSNDGQPVTVAVTTSTTNCGPLWLEAFRTTLTTPAPLTIAVNPAGLTIPQTCNGTVTLTGGGSTVVVPVTLNVSQNALFNISPASLTFSAPLDGSATPVQTIDMSTTDNSAAPFTAVVSTNTGGNWLHILPATGTTPASIGISADPINLGFGVYTGSVIISSTSPSLPVPQIIPVTFKVQSTTMAAVSPASLSFTQMAGAAPPASKDLTLSTGDATASFVTTTQTTDSGSWLSARPNTGMTPSAVTVSVNGSALQPGTYQGSVVLTIPSAANGLVSVPVTMTVLPAQAVSASPSSLTFTQVLGSGAPKSQTVTVTATPVASVSASAQGGAWLSVAPGAAGQFVVAANAEGLALGSYNGTVTFTAGNATSAVKVQLDVLAPAPPEIRAIANAASGVRGSIAPGEIVTLYGVGLGPAGGAGLQITESGKLATAVAGTRVLFDEFEAPILYTSSGQINTVVPYEVAGRALVQVTVEYEGVRSEAVTMQTAAVAPGIFTTLQEGRLQGAVLNQDNFANGVDAPAARGSVIQVFATGEGVVGPPLETGSVTSGVHVPLGRVTATVNGIPAEVVFAGSAPGAVAGLFQVNLRVPQLDLQSVPAVASISISVGGVTSQNGVTVVVK